MSGPTPAYIPPPMPDRPGFYWVYFIFDTGPQFCWIAQIKDPASPVFFAAQFDLETGLEGRSCIPHDVLRWGPRVEFPELS